MEIPKMDSNSIISTLNTFLGMQKQMPPMFSAKKHKGIRLYKLARKNIEVERKKNNIIINKLYLIDFNKNSIKFGVQCSKGTYIRVLGKDIAQKMGTVGYLSSLKRTRVGSYLIDESLSIESFQNQWKSIKN
tara:strand:- start:432 stop:827 length:396 start_codon:yes stop_codon:yes gene_type:complete